MRIATDAACADRPSAVARSIAASFCDAAISMTSCPGASMCCLAWAMSGRIGIDGVWMAYPAAFLTMLVLQTAYYRLVWRRQRIRKLI